jgi:capsid protein
VRTMTQAYQERMNAAELPPGSVVAVLLNQHAWIRNLFADVDAAHGAARRTAFDTLRTLLAIHEAGEEIVVRPISKKAADGTVAEARNAEEKQAAELLADIEKLDVDSEEFARKLTALEKDVSQHAESEEREEFPYLLTSLDADRQLKLGARLIKVEQTAPPHPHPTAAGSTVKQVVIGPFAALLDAARDMFAHPGEDVRSAPRG